MNLSWYVSELHVGHACWHPYTIFCVVQDLLLALALSVFCSITRWIPNMALGNQATVYTLSLSYNFLSIIVMCNNKWLHGSRPKLTTVSSLMYIRRRWRQQAIFGCYVPFNDMSLRAGLDISLRLEKMGLGWVNFCRRRGVVDAKRKALVAVLQWLIVIFTWSVPISME